MRRSGLMTGIGLLLLLGGAYFLVFRIAAPEERQLITENTIEEPAKEEGESLEAVLGEMPKQPAFASITETLFLNEGVAEAKSFETRAIAPLEQIQRLASDTQSLLDKQELKWCEPVTSYSQAESVTNDMYREVIEDERAIRDVQFLSQAVQVGETWNVWLLRLAEAADREGKKEEKRVTIFQESFNDITDEYEETLYQSAQETRGTIDAIIFAEPDIALRSQKLIEELHLSIEAEVNACQEGRTLSTAQLKTVSQTLARWDKQVSTLKEARKKTMNQVLDVSTASIPTVKQKIQAYTERLETATIELQQTLQ